MAEKGGLQVELMRGTDTILLVDDEETVLSGDSIDGQAKEILERGCDGFIQKPFDIEALSQEIREISNTEDEKETKDVSWQRSWSWTLMMES